MKRYEKFALLLVVFLIISKIVPFMGDIFLARTYGPHDLIPFQVLKTWESIYILLDALVHIGAAIWIFAEAKIESLNRWVWGIFGLAFGLIGLVIFYLVLLYQQLHKQRHGT